MNKRATYSVEEEGDGRVLRFEGDLTIDTVGDIAGRLRAEPHVDRLDVDGVGRMDTVGAWLVHRTARDHSATIANADDGRAKLLEEVSEADNEEPPRPARDPAFVKLVADTGEATKIALFSMVGLVGFFGEMMRAAGNVIRHPSRFPVHELVSRFEVVGVRALGIIGLMSFLIGIVIAQQGAVQLRQFGAEVFTINLVGRLTLRELGVLMTAIMVAGRSGSAFAAQLGTMKLTEEIDAMRTIGVSPQEALVLPRVVATVILMPLLGFYASVVAMIGGGLLSWVALDIPPTTFVQRIREVVPITDLYVGLVKAPVFGLIIAIAGCYQGLQVKGNAEEVGKRTTAAVVQAIFMVIVLDAFFAIFFEQIGWI
jgi:phospholipid/cholesterol/gamma-HCH transport system permease protein